MEKDSGLTKQSVVFPFLIEEPKSSYHDAINQSFLSRMLKWPQDKSFRPKDAFPPSKNVLHERDRSLKGFQNAAHKQPAKNYSCPSIVDMSNVIFYNDSNVRQNQPRRIINGFFPNKIRSTHGSFTNDGARNRDQAMQSQVGMCLGRKDSASLTGSSTNHSSSRYLHGPVSRSTTTSQPADRLGIRRTHSSWPVRNGSISPWLQRYKIKKRSATSYALQKPADLGDGESGTKRSQEYVNLSNAVILDAF